MLKLNERREFTYVDWAAAASAFFTLAAIITAVLLAPETTEASTFMLYLFNAGFFFNLAFLDLQVKVEGIEVSQTWCIVAES